MSIEASKQAVRQLVDETLAAFRVELAKAGSTRSTPLIGVRLESGEQARMPWGQPWTHSGLDHLVMHLFLTAVGAQCYAIAMEVRSGGVPPRIGAHASGGMAGWDTAVGEVYRVDDGRLEVVNRVSGDSDQARIAALASVPNLLQPLQTAALSADQQAALKDYVDLLIAQLRKQLRP